MDDLNKPNLNAAYLNEVSGTSFSFLIKLLSSILIAGIAYLALQVLNQMDDMNLASMGFVAAVALVIGFFQLSIWFSTTHISDTHIYQTWMFKKKSSHKRYCSMQIDLCAFFQLDHHTEIGGKSRNGQLLCVLCIKPPSA